jgi:hypothetical protein
MMFGSCFFEAIYDNSSKSISAPFLIEKVIEGILYSRISNQL